MSSKPNPVATTAAMLMQRAWSSYTQGSKVNRRTTKPQTPTFNAIMRYARKLPGAQRAQAKRLGMTQEKWQRLLAGERSQVLEDLDRMARRLGLSIIVQERAKPRKSRQAAKLAALEEVLAAPMPPLSQVGGLVLAPSEPQEMGQPQQNCPDSQPT